MADIPLFYFGLRPDMENALESTNDPAQPICLLSEDFINIYIFTPSFGVI